MPDPGSPPEAIAEDRFAGPWTLDSGTGDFEGLRGSGELSAIRDIPTFTTAQTLTGTIEG